MLRYEVMKIPKNRSLIPMTAEDASYFWSYVPEADVWMIPIGLDLQEFQTVPSPDYLMRRCCS